jgi:hypothetical protein
MDHEWSGWHEDEPGLHDSLGDADTADLADSHDGLEGLGAAPDYPHGGDDYGSGYEGGYEQTDAGLHPANEPLPDDTFGEHPDGGEPLDLSGDHDQPDLTHHEADPADEQPHDEQPHEEAFAAHDQAGDPADHDAGDHVDDPADHDADHDAGDHHVVGADPDVDATADDPGWHDPSFPPPLDWDHVPEPVDGFPWSDPDVLGHEPVQPAGQLDAGYGPPPAGDLFEYAGMDAPTDGDAWSHLLGSDDPATGALARWWAPGS